MGAVMDWIVLPLSYPFMQRAMIVSLLVGAVCAVLSCYLVLKGWSLMGDAISHAVLPGIVIAFVLGLPLAVGAFAAGLSCALLTGYLKETSRVKEDTVMGVVFSGMFGFGLVIFTKVETDAGIYGIGEGTLNAFARTVEAAIHELRDFYIGMDPFQIEVITQRMWRDVYSDGGQIHGCAISAIELACWDIMGKSLNKPVYDLIGGRCHEKLRCYANGWYRGARTPDAFAKNAKKVVKKGYTALKFDPFGAAWRKTKQGTEETYLRVKLDDPAWPQPVWGALLEATEDSVVRLVWRRKDET